MFCTDILLMLDQQKPKMNSPFPENTFCLFRDGSHWVAARLNFQDLQESKAGFGENPLYAMRNLLQEETPPQQGISFVAHGLAIQYNQQPAGLERTVLQSDSHSTAVADLRRVVAARDDTIEYYRQKCAHQEKRISQLEVRGEFPQTPHADVHLKLLEERDDLAERLRESEADRGNMRRCFEAASKSMNLMKDRDELVERIKAAHVALNKALPELDLTHDSIQTRCSAAASKIIELRKRITALEHELKDAKTSLKIFRDKSGRGAW